MDGQKIDKERELVTYLVRDHATKNTVKYVEVGATAGGGAVMTMAYVQREALKRLDGGAPEVIELVVRPIERSELDALAEQLKEGK